MDEQIYYHIDLIKLGVSSGDQAKLDTEDCFT